MEHLLALDGGAGPTVVYSDGDRRRAAEVVAPVLHGPDRSTAVFACSDLIAIGVYDATKEACLRVPDDLSVVGIDDVSEASWGMPPLTRVRQPITGMGEVAVTLLLASLYRSRAPEGPKLPRLDPATSLVVRASTARATKPSCGQRRLPLGPHLRLVFRPGQGSLE